MKFRNNILTSPLIKLVQVFINEYYFSELPDFEDGGSNHDAEDAEVPEVDTLEGSILIDPFP
jgi:hypothetical protein